MTLGEQFVAAARGMVGTPYVHQGRKPGVGLDCAGLVVCALQQCGMPVQDAKGYASVPDDYLLHRLLSAQCDELVDTALEVGDLVLCQVRQRFSRHLAIWAGATCIRTHPFRGVIETDSEPVVRSADSYWRVRWRR